MKAKESASMRVKIAVHWLDEAIILFIVLIAVISADAFKKALKGKNVLWSDFVTGVPNLIIASLVAISVYGGMYTRPYSDKDKPPFIKRASAALNIGFTWRLLMSD